MVEGVTGDGIAAGAAAEPAKADQRESGMDVTRRTAILDLAQNLLFQRNKHLGEDRVKELFFAHGDVISSPRSKNDEDFSRSASSELRDWQAALDIIQFYRGNNVTVPHEVVIVTDTKKPDAGRSLDTRALMYVVSDATHPLTDGDIKMTFSNSLKRGLGTVRTDLPDVYVGPMYAKGTKARVFSISGAQNLIWGGGISQESPHRGHKFDLQAEGMVGIMPDARIAFETPGTLTTTGDITQYGGQAKFGYIEGFNYTKHDGSIQRPEYMEQGKPAIVFCNGKFHDLGGEPIDRLKVMIDDDDVESVATRRARLFATEQGLDTEPLDQGREGTQTTEDAGTLAELSERFEARYPGASIIRRDEGDGSSTVTRTHEIPFDPDNRQEYIDFITLAVSAGWNPVYDTSSEGAKIVTLQKKENPPTATSGSTE